jgi:hypothetical protein
LNARVRTSSGKGDVQCAGVRVVADVVVACRTAELRDDRGCEIGGRDARRETCASTDSMHPLQALLAKPLERTSGNKERETTHRIRLGQYYAV